MSEWGIFSADPNVQYSGKFATECAKYGIVATQTTSDPCTYKFKFSNNENERAVIMGSGHGTEAGFLVNDEKNVVLRLNLSLQIPTNSGSVKPGQIFGAGILPTMSDDLYVFNWGQTSDTYMYGVFDIPNNITELDPYTDELLLFPAIGIIASTTDVNASKFFRDLYVCVQRQFKAGDIIVASNGDRYISMGGWFLFKM